MTTEVTKNWQLTRRVESHNLPSDLPAPVAQILLGRGIDSAEKLRFFLEPPHRLPYDPLRMAGMDRALGRLHQAVNRKEKVGVFGDFDVDGITGTAILAEGLISLGIEVIPYLPHRMTEGHGLSTNAVEQLVDQGVSLIITVDCGVTSIAEVSRARQLGADVIITDHHVPQSEMPDAVAILNPKLPGGSYPFLELCGAGLAFKLVQGLFQFYGQPWPSSLLELAALGTIADLVPLVDENRFLVQEGLRALSRTSRPGLQALYRRAGIQDVSLNTETVAFQISPRLNSSGRMSHAMESYRLLTTNSVAEAEELAERLEGLNRDRRGRSEEAFAIAFDQVRDQSSAGLPAILIVEDSRIAPGVAGLVAGRLAERLNRPAVVMSTDGDYLVASGRSIPEFNIVEAFTASQDLLEKYGGHAQAAGFTVARSKLPMLAANLNAYAERALESQDLRLKLEIDAEIGLEELTDDLLHWVSALEPFGMANPSPVFLSRNVQVLHVRHMGNSGQHVALTVRQGGSEWSALAFNLGERWQEECRAGEINHVDLVYSLTADHWRGPGALALRVRDFRAAGS